MGRERESEEGREKVERRIKGGERRGKGGGRGERRGGETRGREGGGGEIARELRVR